MRHQTDGAPKNSHDFALRFGYRLVMLEDYDRTAWFEDSVYALQLYKNDKLIFADTDYAWFGPDSSFPMLFRFGGDRDEILLRFAEKKYTTGMSRLTIRGDSVIMDYDLPPFLCAPADLAGNGTPYLAHADDIRYYGDSVPYNPVEYYKLTPKGIVYDPKLSRSRNKRIYGRFFGTSRKIPEDDFPEDKLEKEMERIMHMPPMKLDGY